ncbi:MAG TPA: hypothetical protein VHW23_18405 [Kofleriaceae bacterium]|nr:hypothetical protein [Kofleriaceae bacterium]
MAIGLAVAAMRVGAATLAGCGGSQRPASAPTVTLAVIPSAACNRGRPLQAVVRAVTLKQFVEDQYGNIAKLVVGPDESVLSSFAVFPGIAQTITFTPPAKGGFAVYFLFTGATGTSWKQLFDSSPSMIYLELGDDQIVSPTPASPASGDRQNSSP